jgi:hypothetical protein
MASVESSLKSIESSPLKSLDMTASHRGYTVGEIRWNLSHELRTNRTDIRICEAATGNPLPTCRRMNFDEYLGSVNASEVMLKSLSGEMVKLPRYCAQLPSEACEVDCKSSLIIGGDVAVSMRYQVAFLPETAAWDDAKFHFYAEGFNFASSHSPRNLLLMTHPDDTTVVQDGHGTTKMYAQKGVGAGEWHRFDLSLPCDLTKRDGVVIDPMCTIQVVQIPIHCVCSDDWGRGCGGSPKSHASHQSHGVVPLFEEPHFERDISSRITVTTTYLHRVKGSYPSVDDVFDAIEKCEKMYNKSFARDTMAAVRSLISRSGSSEHYPWSGTRGIARSAKVTELEKAVDCLIGKARHELKIRKPRDDSF